MTDEKIDALLKDIIYNVQGFTYFHGSGFEFKRRDRLYPVIRTHLAPYEALRVAAQAVVTRWDSPLWKETEPTGKTIAELRQALAALEGVKG